MPTVLIVDDDKYTQTVLHTALSQDAAFAGLDVHPITADNGEEGLAAFREHRPEIVITDLRMPRMDGVALCRAIRSEPGGAGVHLIAMSGAARDAAAAETVHKEFGAEIFAKPYQLRDMATYIAGLFGGAAPRPVDASSDISASVEARTGNLSERPLPAVLFDLLEAQATGELTLRRGRIEKRIELIVGHPLSVWSSAREEALGAFLLSLGIIRDSDLKRALQWASRRKGKVSEALIALGIVTPEDMVVHITMHTCHKLVQTLRWRDGVWRFEPHEHPPAGQHGNPIDMVPLVLQGLRLTTAFDGLPERMSALEGKPLMLTPRGRRLLPAVRQSLSSKLADEWHDGNTSGALLAAGVERGELYTTLDALLLCDAIGVYEQQDGAGAPASPDAGDFSIEELSEHSQSQRTGRGSEEAARELYAMLFDDPGIMSPVHVGELPIELPDEDDMELRAADSGVIDVSQMRNAVSAATAESESNYARRLVLKEYLHIQGRDYYDIFDLERAAAPEAVSQAIAKRRAKFSLDWFSRYDLGRDYAKLEEIHAAYDRAERVLCDPAKRAAYDRSLGAERHESEPVLAAEIAFHAGLDLLQHGSYEGAIEKLRAAVAASPDEADYHAALGWAYYLKGQRSARAADEARPHLNQGLAINPDHVLSHEYKGLISTEQGTDEEEAIFHLERALDADPGRTESLAALEAIWKRRGELRPLERQYRRLIYRIARNDPRRECQLWLRLAELYRTELQEPASARIAYESAARLAPEDESVRAALAELDRGAPERFAEHREHLRRQWRRAPMSLRPGRELMDAALAAGQPDAAFLAASALVARGCADEEAEAYYLRYRPRFVVRAQRQLDTQIWRNLRHPYDSLELGTLFALVAPAIEHGFPLRPEDLEVDATMAVAEDELPESFVRVRAYAAHMLGVPIPRVFVRPDFGHQIHVGALAEPVLLAGDEALTSPERTELSFRLGRAMTYLLPGRALAASRPARLLRAAVLAVFSRLEAGAAGDDPLGQVAQVQASLDLVAPEALAQAQEIVARITTKRQSLNLSRWVRALGRTANRVGLLLCGDLPAAVRFARDSGTTEGIDDLIDFAVSESFGTVRAQTGLSIDV